MGLWSTPSTGEYDFKSAKAYFGDSGDVDNAMIIRPKVRVDFYRPLCRVSRKVPTLRIGKVNFRSLTVWSMHHMARTCLFRIEVPIINSTYNRYDTTNAM